MNNYDHNISINHKLGYGAIFEILIYTKIFAHINKGTYCPSRIFLIPINDDIENNENWHQIFNFLLQFNLIGYDQNVKRISFFKAYRAFKSCSNSFKEELLNNVRKEFYENFNKKYPTESKNIITIAIHLRCPSEVETVGGILTLPYQHFDQNYHIFDNCTSYYKLLFSFTVNKIYDNITNNGTNKKIKLHVHSLCNKALLEQFKLLINPNIEVIYFSDNAFKSFIDFIQCDHFIAAHSSFSYLAVLLRNSNTYIRGGFRHYVPKYVNIIDEKFFWNYNFYEFKFYYLNFIKFFIHFYYYIRSAFAYFKNFLIGKKDA